MRASVKPMNPTEGQIYISVTTLCWGVDHVTGVHTLKKHTRSTLQVSGNYLMLYWGKCLRFQVDLCTLNFVSVVYWHQFSEFLGLLLHGVFVWCVCECFSEQTIRTLTGF